MKYVVAVKVKKEILQFEFKRKKDAQSFIKDMEKRYSNKIIMILGTSKPKVKKS